MAHRCSYCGKAGHKRPTCPARPGSSGATPGTAGLPASRHASRSSIVPVVEGEEVCKKSSKKPEALTAWKIAEAVIPHSSRILLYGPPGTGKTTAANFAALKSGQVYNVTLTEEMPAAELRGQFVPKGGEFVWHDGPALQAYRNGGRLVLNEIDRGSSDALIFCYALLDDPGISKISLPTSEHVTPHEDFSVVATMNGEPSDLPEALQDRFVSILIDKPHPDAMKSLPEDLQDAAHNSVSGTGESRVSFRTWRNFADLRDLVGEEIAAKAVFGPRAQSILDTLKLSRVKTHTLETDGSEIGSDEPRGVAGFLPGDTVTPKAGYHAGTPMTVADCKTDTGETLEGWYKIHGRILVEVAGESFHYFPSDLEFC